MRGNQSSDVVDLMSVSVHFTRVLLSTAYPYSLSTMPFCFKERCTCLIMQSY